MNHILVRFWIEHLKRIDHPDLDVRRRAVMLRGACLVFIALVALGNATSAFMLSGKMLVVALCFNTLFALVCVFVLRRTARGHVDREGLLVFMFGTFMLFASAAIAGDDDGAVMLTSLCVTTGAFILKPRSFWIVTTFAFLNLIVFYHAFPGLLTTPQNFVGNFVLLLLGAAFTSQLGRISHEVLQQNMESARRREHEAKLARQQATQANLTKSNFLASMSHELRTPLNAIIGYAELIQEENELLEYPAHEEDVGRIERSARHLLSLINDILDLSKIEAERVELHVEQTLVSTLLLEVEEAIAPLIARNFNTFKSTVEEGAPGVLWVDTLRVKQILLNVLSNAAKFTFEGEIRLIIAAANAEGSHISWRIEDQGIGMTPEQLSKVFDEFAQASTETARDFGGTGLGLPIARKLCEAMGGSLEAESTPGEGSAFTMIIPCDGRDTAREVRADAGQA